LTRAEKEAGDASTVDTSTVHRGQLKRVGKDGKARKVPVKKAQRAKSAAKSPPAKSGSEKAFGEFKLAANHWLPKMDPDTLRKAIALVSAYAPGSTSPGDERLREENHRLVTENGALKSEVEELRGALAAKQAPVAEVASS
jgi:hypothetical protein